MTLLKEQGLDERDQAIAYERWKGLAMREALQADKGVPTVGDWVEYPDGNPRRVSYVWDWNEPSEISVQTSDSGSWYLGGDGSVSFSGGLCQSVAIDTFTIRKGVCRRGKFWFFHHDHATAQNGVDLWLPVLVWDCTDRSGP